MHRIFNRSASMIAVEMKRPTGAECILRPAPLLRLEITIMSGRLNIIKDLNKQIRLLVLKKLTLCFSLSTFNLARYHSELILG
jgi:hypothetical protein